MATSSKIRLVSSGTFSLETWREAEVLTLFGRPAPALKSRTGLGAERPSTSIPAGDLRISFNMRSTRSMPCSRTMARRVLLNWSSLIASTPHSGSSQNRIIKFLHKVLIQGGVTKMTEIPSHHLGKSARERNLIPEDPPIVFPCFGREFSNSPVSFRTTFVAAVVICRVVDHDARDIKRMARIACPEQVQGVLKKIETDGREVLRPYRNQDIPRSMICDLRKDRFGGRAINNDDIAVLKLFRNKRRKHPCVGPDCIDETIGEIES